MDYLLYLFFCVISNKHISVDFLPHDTYCICTSLFSEGHARCSVLYAFVKHNRFAVLTMI